MHAAEVGKPALGASIMHSASVAPAHVDASSLTIGSTAMGATTEGSTAMGTTTVGSAAMGSTTVRSTAIGPTPHAHHGPCALRAVHVPEATRRETTAEAQACVPG